MKKITSAIKFWQSCMVLSSICVLNTPGYGQWSLTGNAGTNSSTNFVGTTDNVALKFRTKNTIRMTISSGGKVGIGNSSPGYRLDVKGGSINTDSLYRISGVQVLNRDASNNIEIGSGSAKVGIGTTAPDARLTLANTSIGGISTAGTFQIGPSNAYNLVMDNNEVQVRNNGSAGTLFLQYWGGNVDVCASGGMATFNGPVVVTSSDLTVGGRVGINSAPAYDWHVSSVDYSAGYVASPYNGGTVLNVIANGTTAGTWGLYSYATTLGYAAYFSGNIYCSGSYLPSDERLKENIQPLQNALDRVMKLDVKTYNFKSGLEKMNLPMEKQYGFLAQNLETVFPELVKLNPAKKEQPLEFKAVNYLGMIPVLTEAVQEQQKQLEAKDKAIAHLQNQLNELQQCVQSLCDHSALKSSTSASASESIKLFQNQPNPFNQSTLIRYELSAEQSNGIIVIRDLSGNSIKSIAVHKAGKGQVLVNANELVPGTYTYSLEADGESVDTKLMVITR